jgi:hypothetical protein
MDRVLKIENTAATSVDDIIELIKNDFRNDHPVT